MWRARASSTGSFSISPGSTACASAHAIKKAKSNNVAPPPRGGRTERHGLSPPIAAFSQARNRRTKSDGVPGGGDGEARAVDTPTRCVQRLSPAVEYRARLVEAALS